MINEHLMSLERFIGTFCISILIFLFVLGYRCFKVVMFLTGFIFASSIVYLICIQGELMPPYGNAGKLNVLSFVFGGCMWKLLIIFRSILKKQNIFDLENTRNLIVFYNYILYLGFVSFILRLIADFFTYAYTNNNNVS